MKQTLIIFKIYKFDKIIFLFYFILSIIIKYNIKIINFSYTLLLNTILFYFIFLFYIYFLYLWYFGK